MRKVINRTSVLSGIGVAIILAGFILPAMVEIQILRQAPYAIMLNNDLLIQAIFVFTFDSYAILMGMAIILIGKL